jgi:hypothetical protein
MTLETPAVPAPVGTDRLTDDGEAPGPKRRRRRRLLPAAGAVAALIVLIVLIVVLRGRGSRAPARDRAAGRVISMVAVAAHGGEMPERLTIGVALVKALGGGWDAASLPPADAVLAGASSNR